MTLVYLDHAATTPLRPEARAAMEPFLGAEYGNPSSVYSIARRARAALDNARDQVAGCLGAGPGEIVFTSGGTESNNAALKGVALAHRARGRHIVTTAIEHHAVLHPLEDLRDLLGFELTVLPVSAAGILDAEEFAAALRPDTVLASVMWANNEIGTIQPIEQIAEMTRERGIPLHVDAVQAAGTLPIDLHRVPVDLLSISAHKFYGPKGVGALFLRRGTPFVPLLSGGGQERERRSGTENVAGIAGMAAAFDLACRERSVAGPRLRALRDRLLEGIRALCLDVVVNGDLERRLPGNLNVCLPGVHGESLLVGLDLAGVMASSGSACASGSLEPSHVLLALGLPTQLAQSSLRLTLGRETASGDIERTLAALRPVVERLRRLAPAAQE